MNGKLKWGMMGGGINAFIGAAHRIAANMDGLIELVCGAFSSSPENARQSGKDLFLPENWVYLSYEEMIEKESRLPDTQRMDFVVIVTPNHAHIAPAMLAHPKSIQLVIEKAITSSHTETIQLK